MTAIIIIGIIIFVVYTATAKKQPIRQRTEITISNVRKETEKEVKVELVQNTINNNILTLTTSNSTESNYDDSILDITDQSYSVISNNNLKKYSSGVPYWSHHYVYSYWEISSATVDQKKFYGIFKTNFLNGEYFDLEGNTNYAFILLFDLLKEYDIHKDISKLESQLRNLGQYYPKTKSYGVSFLIKKMELEGSSNDVARLREEEKYSTQNYSSNYDYWRLGSKYKAKLNLNDDEVNLLNKLWNPSNSFYNIEFCCLEILKLYLAVISELKAKYEKEETTIEKEFTFVADVIARKHFKFRSGSQNYKYSIESTINTFYSTIFRYCENAVRESYGHKRKLNTDNYYTNDEAKSEFDSKIITKVTELLSTLIYKITPPDEATEVELNSLTTNRWKIKFEELTSNFKGNSIAFIEDILILGKVNSKNPSIENIFYEASKFIAKYDKIASLTLYVHYLYHDLKSTTFDNKQLTKTIQKSLFKTNEQLHDFEQIVSELIKDKNLDKALNAVPKIYELKRKKIQLDLATIKEVQQQHTGTVELLNEYLRDEFEDENSSIHSQEISSDEIKIEISRKIEESYQSRFVSELPLSPTHILVLEMFSKNNFSIPLIEIEEFAKSKGIFKNQLIDSINETCYEVLDDILIEEEDDYYTIIPEYFQKILQNDR